MIDAEAKKGRYLVGACPLLIHRGQRLRFQPPVPVTYRKRSFHPLTHSLTILPDFGWI